MDPKPFVLLPEAEGIYAPQPISIRGVASTEDISTLTGWARYSDTQYADVWLDLGGAFTKVFPQTVSFAKGNNVPHFFTYTAGVYVGSTWAANGARGVIRAENTAAVYNVDYTIQRIHHGVTTP